MGTAFQLTPAQARKLGIDTGSTRESKPRRRKTAEERLLAEQVQQRIDQGEVFRQRILYVTSALGWKTDLCRFPSDDPRNNDYPSLRDDEATPNAVIAWRDCVEYANPRTMFLAWLWEIEGMSEEEMVKRVNRLEVAA